MLILNKTRAAWQKMLIEPAAAIGDHHERRRARLLSVTLLVPLALTLVWTMILLVANEGAAFPLFPLALAGLLVAYILSRTRFIHWAAVLGLALIHILPFIGAIINPSNLLILAFLLNGVLLCTLFFSSRVTLLVVAADLAGLVFLPLVNPAIPWQSIFLLTLMLIGGVILIVALQSIRQEDRRQMEDQARSLADSELRYRLIAENATDMISRHTLAGVYLYVSPSVSSLLGYEPHDLIGRSAYDFFHPDDRADIQRSHDAIRREATVYTVAYRIQRKDGSYIWFETTSKVIRDSQTDSPWEILSVSRDVTGRKMVEEVMRDSEARFRAAAEGSLDAFSLLQSERDSSGQISDFIFIELNNRAEDLIRMSRDRVIGGRLCELMPFNRTSGTFDKYVKVVETRLPLEEEFTLSLPNDDVVWLHHQIIPVGDGVAITTRNITERKQTEAEIKQSKLLLEASYDTLQRLIQQMPIGVQIFDTQGLCTGANQAHTDIFGVQRDVLVGHFNLLTDRMAAQTGTRGGYERALQGEFVHLGEIEFDFVNADPRFTANTGRRYVSVSFFPLFDAHGAIVSVVALNQDVTERHLAEQALTNLAAEMYQQKNTLDAVLAATPDLLSIYDRDGHYIYANTAAVAANPYDDLSQLKGKSWRDLGWPPALGEQFEADFQQVIQSGEPANGMLEFTEAGGSRYIEYVLSPVLDAQGEVALIVSTNRDVTEQRQAEQERLELALQRERVQMLQHLISDTSHDLKTPLATLNTSVYLLKKSISDPERRERYAEVLQAQVMNLSKILDDMDSMARLDSEGDAFEFEPMDMSDLVRQIVDEHESLASHRNQTLRFTPVKNLPLIQADAVKLRRAVTNLIANALNYTPEGGKIDALVMQEGNCVVIEVHDNGLGISAAELPLIFERFYRSEDSRKVNSGGSGLGLAITQKIIEAHGGRIEVESAPGMGSTFRVLLPVQK